MRAQQHGSIWMNRTAVFSMLVIGISLISACGAADAPEGDSGFSVPTDPPSGQGPLPTAEEVLEGMVGLMEAQQDLAVESYVTYEVLQDSGQLLSFNTARYVDMRRPNLLTWTTVRDNATADEVWFADGVLTMLKHPETIYGQIEDLPAEIAEAVDVLVEEYGIFVPFSDLISGRARQVFLDETESMMYVGEAWIRGQWTHHLALRGGDFDIEMWVSAEGDPVPLRMTIRWINEEGHPSFTARFRNWNLNPVFDESTFAPILPDDAERVTMVPIIDAAGGE